MEYLISVFIRHNISDYAINSILYQRGIYPSESFDTITKYNLKIVDTCDDKLKDYLTNVLETLEGELLTINLGYSPRL